MNSIRINIGSHSKDITWINQKYEMKSYKIRPYLPQDFDELIHIFKTNVPDSFAETEIADLKTYLQEEIQDYFVITENNQILGAAGINYDDDQITARLSWDFMDQKKDHKGAGTAITQHRIDLIRKLPHIKRLIVRTSQFAEGFYKKQGFITIERVPDYWAKGYDLIFMEFQNLN